MLDTFILERACDRCDEDGMHFISFVKVALETCTYIYQAHGHDLVFTGTLSDDNTADKLDSNQLGDRSEHCYNRSRKFIVYRVVLRYQH